MIDTTSNAELPVTPTLDDYANAARWLWRDAGQYAVDSFARLNRDLFGNELPALPIVIGLTAFGRCIGLTRYDWLGDPRITLAPRLFNRDGVRDVDDTLTHEMVHAVLFLRGENTKHNHAPWCMAITALSPKVLGHEITARPVGTRRVPNPAREHDATAEKTKVVRQAEPGALTRKQLAEWPHSLRPADFDHGPTISVPTY